MDIWHTNPFSIFLFVSCALMIGLGVVAWWQRASLGIEILVLLCGNLLWLAGYAAALGVNDYSAHMFWAKFQFLGIGIVFFGILLFTLKQSDHPRWMTRRKLLLLMIVPVTGMLLAWSNDWHHLVWLDAQLVNRNGLALLDIQYGPFLWFYTVYNYLSLAFGGLIFWRKYLQGSDRERGQAAIILVGLLLPFLVNIFYLSKLNYFPYLDLTMLGCTLTSSFITWGMLRYFILDKFVIPRNKVVQDMPDAVMVMDARDRLRDVNPAALKLLGLSEKQVIGNSLQALRKDSASDMELLLKYHHIMEGQGDFSLGNIEDPQHFSFRLTPLYDWRNKLSGRLLVLRDTSELHKREVALQKANARLEDLNARLINEMASRETVQNLVLQQQRALMTLDERERLGRELHDGLGQVMGYLTIEAQSAQAMLQNRDVAGLQESLEKIANVARDGHDDVRGFILGLRTASSRMPLKEGLRLILEQFNQRSGLNARLTYPETAHEPAFEVEVELVALQLVRESLANIRKHARAQQVSVSFEFDGDLALVEIIDDGLGFDPQFGQSAAETGEPARPAGHFGLAMMREQVEKVTGRFEIFSAPGMGTRIRVQLPCLGQPIESEDDDLRTARGLRILLVDDHPLFLDGLRTLLKSRGLTVVGMAHDGFEAQSMAEALRPNIVVMDINMPGCNGLEATRLIKLSLPKTQVLILTVSEDEDSLYEAIKNGASGYLPKSLDVREFVRLLASLSRGETPLSAGMAQRLIRKYDRRSPEAQVRAGEWLPERPEVLTDRQWQILQSVSQGQRYKEIAQQLELSERTVKREMGQVLELLHLENRKDAMNFTRGKSS